MKYVAKIIFSGIVVTLLMLTHSLVGQSPSIVHDGLKYVKVEYMSLPSSGALKEPYSVEAFWHSPMSESGLGIGANQKRRDNLGPIEPWKIPEIPTDFPEVRIWFEYANEFIEKYNDDKIRDISTSLLERWNVKKDQLQEQYLEFKPETILFYSYEKDSDQYRPLIITMVSRLLNTGYPYNEKSRQGYRSTFILFAAIPNNELTVFGGYFPLLDEKCCCVLRKDATNGFQFMSFSSEREEPRLQTPWIVWKSDGTILEQMTKNLIFEDYSLFSYAEGEPKLRGALIFSAGFTTAFVSILPEEP